MKKYILSLSVIILIVFCILSCGNQQLSDANSTDLSNSYLYSNNADSTLPDFDSNDGLDNENSNNADSTLPDFDSNDGLDNENSNNNGNKLTLSIAEKRDLKVSFNIDMHHMGNLPEKDDNSTVLDRHLIAVMGKNEEGNDYIEYSPNAYSFYLLITCQETLNEAWNVIDAQIHKHFAGGSKDNSTTFVDAVAIKENTIMVCFPDFYSYSLCQEEMLNKLSEKDSVLSVEIGYLNTQNGTTKPKNTYEYINVGNAFEEHRYIKSYDEFVSLLGNKIETNEKLQKITAQTFEENYVFIVVNWHYRNFDISDAKLVNDTVFFTTNCYGLNGELHSMRAYNNACITFVPKSELGELPQEITVRGLEIFLLSDEWYDSPFILFGFVIPFITQ